MAEVIVPTEIVKDNWTQLWGDKEGVCVECEAPSSVSYGYTIQISNDPSWFRLAVYLCDKHYLTNSRATIKKKFANKILERERKSHANR